MSRGFSSKEILLGIFMLVVVAAVLVPLSFSMRTKGSQDEDIQRMRRLYMTLAMYESQSNDLMPSTLEKARYLTSSAAELESIKDPYVGSGQKFPVDAGIPNYQVSAPERISWTYVYAYQAATKQDVAPWYELKYKQNAGFLANEWLGEFKQEGNFKATVSGKIYRLNTDGAMKVIDRSAPSQLGNFDELFETTPTDK